MNMALKPMLLLFCVICLAGAALAKPWRGLVPLHSTRADVRRLLGKPIIGAGGSIDLYELKQGRVHIRYARRPCEQGLPADWGNWNVRRDTVVNISITLNADIPVADLRIRNLEKYKWYTDDSGATYYHDKRNGIEYQVQEGLVTAITYGPTARDRLLRCKKNVQLIRY